jgi:fatty-acyl-CoA synthase
MAPEPIVSRESIRAIEAQPYSAFMPFTDVFDALQAGADRHPEQAALVYLRSADPLEAADRWSYRELVDGVARAAALFHDLADGEEPRVAMLLPAIPAAYFTLWGGEAAGVVCPINYLLDAGHIAQLVRAAGANILVALGPNPELDIWSRVPEVVAACPGLKQVLAVGAAAGFQDLDTALAQQPVHWRWRRAPDARRLAALFHTGGTTGAPKLAQHTHGNQLHSAWGAARMYAMAPQDRILNGFPLFHVAGAFVYGLSALLSGATVVLPTLLGLRNAAFVQRYWQFVESERVTLLAAVPTVIATLLHVEPGGSSLQSVRALLTGGSPLPGDLAAAFEQRFGLPVRNILGMTECAGVVSIEPFAAPRTPGSCGVPLPFVEVEAVGADGLRCAPGESGVLRLRGPNVGPGYTDPARNAGTFDDGWLNTGDIGHVDVQGRVFVTGRAKDVIIRGGHNIDPQLIEEALLRHADVLMAAAVGAPDAHAGELPVAFVALKPDAQADAAALMAVAQRHIPERPAWPKRIDVLPALPTTAIGKIYKPALRALACRRVLTEKIEAAGLADRAEVRVVDAAAGLQVVFDPQAGADPAELRRALAPLMQAYALRWEVSG